MRRTPAEFARVKVRFPAWYIQRTLPGAAVPGYTAGCGPPVGRHAGWGWVVTWFRGGSELPVDLAQTVRIRCLAATGQDWPTLSFPPQASGPRAVPVCPCMRERGPV
jgi:hypothetical protein